MPVKKIVLITVVTFILIIAFQNLKPVPVQLLFWQIQVPLIWILLFAFGLGWFSGGLLKLYRQRSRGADTAPQATPSPPDA